MCGTIADDALYALKKDKDDVDEDDDNDDDGNDNDDDEDERVRRRRTMMPVVPMVSKEEVSLHRYSSEHSFSCYGKIKEGKRKHGKMLKHY